MSTYTLRRKYGNTVLTCELIFDHQTTLTTVYSEKQNTDLDASSGNAGRLLLDSTKMMMQ